MGQLEQSQLMPEHLKIWGPMAVFGLVAAAIALGIDQGFKTWMLHYYNIAERQPVSITSFFDLVIIFNKGISYGWLKGLGPWPLIIGQSLVTLFLWLWMAGSDRKFNAIVLGMIIGGALGNIVDRFIYGGVADFFFLHAFGFSWYVFNLADVAVVVGAVILVYTSFTDKPEN